MEIRTRSKIVINKGFKPINPIQCGDERCLPSHSFGPAIRDHYLLHYVISGKGRFQTEKGQYSVFEDQIFIIRPYEITYYEADASDPWSYVWIGFTSEVELPPELDSADVIIAPELKELFMNAASDQCYNAGSTGGAYECFLTGIIWQMIGMLKKRGENLTKLGEGYVSSAMSIIHSEYQTALTVDMIASRLHINRSYFSDIFKKVVGVSPKRYLDSFRMKKAAELLVTKGTSVTVTAISVGYGDVFTFSRAFKNHFGVSPSEYADYERHNGVLSKKIIF